MCGGSDSVDNSAWHASEATVPGANTCNCSIFLDDITLVWLWFIVNVTLQTCTYISHTRSP